MADVTERIEKQMEGTNLALAAVAEVLQKMDARLSKEDADAIANANANSQAAAKADLVKSIAKEVISVLKEADSGLDVSGGERKAKATGGTPQNSDDSESSANPTTKIEDQQNTIQASRLKKEDDEEEEEELEEELEKKKGMGYKDEEATDDEAADYPVTEEKGEDDEEDEEDDVDEMKSMRKQLAVMKKELAATKGEMQKSITTEAESRLRKMGFREETGLKAPKLAGLGVDNTPLVKASNGDVTGQLADLSYKQLRDLQHKIESGDTNGVPRELLN